MNYDIELKDISVAVHRKKLLSRIDLNIKKGEFLTVLGPNGSGKTTLVKTILGMRPPSAGKAFVCGIDTALRPAEAGKKMSYIPQGLDTDKFFPASAGDVIACAVINGWGIKNSNKKNINGAVEEMGVGHLLKQPFGTLSGGEKQKIMLAGALARDPEVIILDEPNLNLDPYAYKVLLNTLSKINALHKITVVFVTHLMDMIPGSCGRIAVIKRGKLISDKSAKDTFNMKNVREYIYG